MVFKFSRTHHYSAKSFSDRAIQPITKSYNNITGIEIPNDLDGQNLQIRVASRVLGQVVSNASAPAIVGKLLVIFSMYTMTKSCYRLISGQIANCDSKTI